MTGGVFLPALCSFDVNCLLREIEKIEKCPQLGVKFLKIRCPLFGFSGDGSRDKHTKLLAVRNRHKLGSLH